MQVDAAVRKQLAALNSHVLPSVHAVTSALASLASVVAAAANN